VVTSLAFSIFTPFGTLPGISIPVFMAGTAVGVGAVLMVSPYARFDGPFRYLRPGSSAAVTTTTSSNQMVGSR
jgi:hypothetical protein